MIESPANILTVMNDPEVENTLTIMLVAALVISS